jgi:hypothetical protein
MSGQAKKGVNGNDSDHHKLIQLNHCIQLTILKTERTIRKPEGSSTFGSVFITRETEPTSFMTTATLSSSTRTSIKQTTTIANIAISSVQVIRTQERVLHDQHQHLSHDSFHTNKELNIIIE